MTRRAALLLLLLALPAFADETPAFTKTTALQAKLLAFLSGATPPGQSPDAIPGLTQADPPPGWLVHWQATLLRDLQQPDLRQSHHPLLRATLQVVRLQAAAKPTGEPILAAPLPLDALLCPRDAPVRLRVEVLHSGDDAIPPWLGVDVNCVDAKPMLRQQVRLLVHATAQGHVLRAFGVAWTQALALPAHAEPGAMPEFVLHPALLDKRFRWLVALPAGGWLAQLQTLEPAGWHSDDTLPRVETVHPGDDAQTAAEEHDAQRYTLLLAEDGTPRAALLHGPVDGDGRLPLWHEGAWDLPLPQAKPEDIVRTLLVQRIARPGALDAAQVGRTWTHAGYALWQVTADAVHAVDLPLLPLDQEGVWDCEAEPPTQTMVCAFRRLGPASEAGEIVRRFTLLPGPLASFRLLPGKD